MQTRLLGYRLLLESYLWKRLLLRPWQKLRRSSSASNGTRKGPRPFLSYAHSLPMDSSLLVREFSLTVQANCTVQVIMVNVRRFRINS
jgi:hypothetical protein